MSKSHYYKTLLFTIACLVSIAVSGCFTPPATREPVTNLTTTSLPSDEAKLITYRVQLDGKGFIRLLHPETLVETTVYTSDSIIESPIWSPDGDTLSFNVWTGEDELLDLWVINRDGSGLRRMATDVQVESLVAQGKWSFDEQLLAYRASYNRLEPSEAELFIINTNTAKVLCRVPHVWTFEWSPIDNMLAYIPWTDQKVGIQLVKVNDCSERLILSFNSDEITSFTPALSWSPDGKWIAFAGQSAHDSLTEITLVNTDSGEWKKLTNAIASGYASREIHDLEWSPDGKHILFRSTYEQQNNGGKARNDLFIVEVNTGQEQKLAEQVSYPVWSPNSEAIAFVTKQNDEDNEQIYKVEVSTGDITKLTDTLGKKEFLSWR